MTLPAELRKDRCLLTAMILELHTNLAALDELANRYGLFVFTGGDLPRGRCGLVATTVYLERPFATDRISTAEVERYRHSVQTLMELGPAIVAPRPRTLRCRHDITDTFRRLASEIRTVGSTLESTLTQLSEEQKQSSPVCAN